MKLKKRKKSGKLRGFRTHGFAGKKHKGKGNVGGKGMSGTGKRADQKKTLVLNYPEPYFGKRRILGGRKKKKNLQINIDDIVKNLKDKKELKLKDYKILGRGEIKQAIVVKAKAFSKQAKEKIEKAGGKAIVLEKEENAV